MLTESSVIAGEERTQIDLDVRASIEMWYKATIAISVVFLIATAALFKGILELLLTDFDEMPTSAAGKFVDTLFFPREECMADWVRPPFATLQLLVVSVSFLRDCM